jgi:leucyl/phenylalanyl-tRNA--protein transferase
VPLTVEVILRAYSIGIFPMAQTRTDPAIHWVAPTLRGILPLESFHVPRRLRRVMRRSGWEIRIDKAFETVIDACAAPRPGQPETWINDDIARVFCRLHRLGYAHSVEAWYEGSLAGGLYGLALGGAFFGESMFSRRAEASKIALVHLAALLRMGGFALLDVQFLTDHLRQFGAVEIPAADYLQRLEQALAVPAVFYSAPGRESWSAALSALLTQSSSQTS